VIWRDEWRSIGARIQGLLKAADFYIRTIGVSGEDRYSVPDKNLAEQSREIINSLTRFLKAHKTVIPSRAATVLRRFLEGDGMTIADQRVKGISGLRLRITLLVALRSEIEYYLSDFETVASKKTERAFLHLQQSIAADETVSSKWKDAFSAGEAACEKLGAAHLMLHGIWAFKIHASGARTDLVFGYFVSEFLFLFLGEV